VSTKSVQVPIAFGSRSSQALASMFPIRHYISVLGIMIVLATVARLFWTIPSGVSLLVLLIGWPLVGTMLTIDDDLPGGWSNPDGTLVPEWKMPWWWADLMLVRGAIVVAAFAIEGALVNGFSLYPWIVVALMVIAGLPVFIKGVREEAARAG